MKTKDFIARFTPENQELIDRMMACKAPEEAYEVAKSEGVTDGFEEFNAAMTEFYESVKHLTIDDLANVAGGEKTSITVSISITAVSTVYSAASAASVGMMAAAAAN